MKKILTLTLLVISPLLAANEGATDFEVTKTSFRIRDNFDPRVREDFDTTRVKIAHLMPLGKKLNMELGARFMSIDSSFDDTTTDGRSFSAGVHVMDKTVHIGLRHIVQTLSEPGFPDEDIKYYEFDAGVALRNSLLDFRVLRAESEGDSVSGALFSARHFMGENFLLGVQLVPSTEFRAYTVMGELMAGKNVSVKMSYTDIRNLEDPDATVELDLLSIGLNIYFDGRAKSIKKNKLDGRYMWDPELFKFIY